MAPVLQYVRLFSRAIDFSGNFTNKLEVDTYYNWFFCLCSTLTSHQRVTNTLNHCRTAFFRSTKSVAVSSIIFRHGKAIEIIGESCNDAVARSIENSFLLAHWMRKNHVSFKICKTNRSMLLFENCVIIRH